jgi:iodotyrosine deiodinase
MDAERLRRVEAFEAVMRSRRSARVLADAPVPRAGIESALRTAGTERRTSNRGPSWRSPSDAGLERRIRAAAEAEERRFDGDTVPRARHVALEPLDKDANRPFSERAPWRIAVFAQRSMAQG